MLRRGTHLRRPPTVETASAEPSTVETATAEPPTVSQRFVGPRSRSTVRLATALILDSTEAEVAPFDEWSVVSQITAVAKRRLCDT
jgi:hypothetical protein